MWPGPQLPNPRKGLPGRSIGGIDELLRGWVAHFLGDEEVAASCVRSSGGAKNLEILASVSATLSLLRRGCLAGGSSFGVSLRRLRKSSSENERSGTTRHD